jgi:hypothetical protein
MSYNQNRRDYSSHDGAVALATRLVDYWRERGHEVRVQVVCDKDPGDPFAMWHVRTDLVRGQPKNARRCD